MKKSEDAQRLQEIHNKTQRLKEIHPAEARNEAQRFQEIQLRNAKNDRSSAVRYVPWCVMDPGCR